MELTKAHFDTRIDEVLAELGNVGGTPTNQFTLDLPPRGEAMTLPEAFNVTKDNPNATFEADFSAGVFRFKVERKTPFGTLVMFAATRPIAGF